METPINTRYRFTDTEVERMHGLKQLLELLSDEIKHLEAYKEAATPRDFGLALVFHEHLKHLQRQYESAYAEKCAISNKDLGPY